jgi:hypothetical protein
MISHPLPSNPLISSLNCDSLLRRKGEQTIRDVKRKHGEPKLISCHSERNEES